MGKKETIEEKAWLLLNEAAEACGVVPVDAEYAARGKEYDLLMYIDKEGGVTVEDCERTSRYLDGRLDEEDFIPDAYTLYVSSPGLTRPIRRPRDFIFAKGKPVEGATYKPVSGQKEFAGVLADFDGEAICIEDEDGQQRRIERKQIARLQLAFTD